MKKIAEKHNILFVLVGLGAGGSERVVLDLARHLDRSKFDVYVAYFISGVLEEQFRGACREIFHISKRKGFDLASMLKVSRIIRNSRIDTVNAHHYMPYFYSYLGSKILNKRGLIYTEHTAEEVERISGVHKWLCNKMMHNTNSIVGISKGIQEAFRRAFPRHYRRIVSIPNGIELERFEILVNQNGLRRQWGLLPEHFVVGTVAGFRRQKNHQCLIRAFHRLIRVHPNIRLFLVGPGSMDFADNTEQEVRQLIRTYGLKDSVVIAGERQDVPEILKTFDVFCLPSFYEGLPLSILEAMATGVPVVGSDVRGIREVVIPEETGLLFPSDDDNALAQALERLIKDKNLRNNLCKNAFTFVSQTHGIKQWVSAYECLFKSV